jgi:hypothetical protein
MPRGLDPSFGPRRYGGRRTEWECANCSSYNDFDETVCHGCGAKNHAAPTSESDE